MDVVCLLSPAKRSSSVSQGRRCYLQLHTSVGALGFVSFLSSRCLLDDDPRGEGCDGVCVSAHICVFISGRVCAFGHMYICALV